MNRIKAIFYDLDAALLHSVEDYHLEVDGAKAFIRDGKDSNCLQFAVSEKLQKKAKELVDSMIWSYYFNDVSGYPLSKQMHINKNLILYGLNPDNCLYIGSSEKDYAIAKDLGIRFLARNDSGNFAVLNVSWRQIV